MGLQFFRSHLSRLFLNMRRIKAIFILFGREAISSLLLITSIKSFLMSGQKVDKTRQLSHLNPVIYLCSFGLKLDKLNFLLWNFPNPQ